MTCEPIPTPSLQPIKQGDSFLLSCTYQENGQPVDVTDYAIQSQVRDSVGTLLQTLLVVKQDQAFYPGKFTLDGGVIAWPVDLLACDIQTINGDGFVRSSQTFSIPIISDVTRD